MKVDPKDGLSEGIRGAKDESEVHRLRSLSKQSCQLLAERGRRQEA